MTVLTLTALTTATAIGAALVAGIFYAFSTFIMQALGRLEPSAGIAAMQSINVVVINPLFFAAFFGTGIASLATVGARWFGEGPLGVAVPLGCVLYVVGCIGTTIVFNVPLNDRLAAVDALDASSVALWQLYLSRWTFWNHVRTGASLLASVALLVALLGQRG